ncbi:hypothetical protein IMG5_001730 [Ichthyophthirius multifiliis]|uniref:Uncharacterized protein n=1 Tax=Ichthyophthirius multifiliis TaxID=5932 RepID=G0QJ03_ICHMU|nr:hypothetical protein IMG5_001730 [Ichthyophthirius multifiliis]EGR34796.1 hypothetical protein IMG5_001730 [Ichthyophthirius multifiliis]|eukprot:XP_004040100.1 hypothetical protein IMG5_001730 [Ichthyophthirius multifiliis]
MDRLLFYIKKQSYAKMPLTLPIPQFIYLQSVSFFKIWHYSVVSTVQFFQVHFFFCFYLHVIHYWPQIHISEEPVSNKNRNSYYSWYNFPTIIFAMQYEFKYCPSI